MRSVAIRRERRRRDRGRLAGAMLDAHTALWLGRLLWRPVAAELARERGDRRARSRRRRRG